MGGTHRQGARACPEGWTSNCSPLRLRDELTPDRGMSGCIFGGIPVAPCSGHYASFSYGYDKPGEDSLLDPITGKRLPEETPILCVTAGPAG